MNPDTDIFQLINNLGGLDLRMNEINVQLLVMTKDHTLYRTNTDASIEEGLIDCFVKPVCNYLTTEPDNGLILQEYDPQQNPDHPVLWTLPVDDVPAFETAKEQLSQSPDSIDIYHDETGNLEGVIALALRVQIEDQEMIVFQKLLPQGILKNSRKFGIFFDGSSFGKLEYPTTFQVSHDNHVVYFNETIHILHNGNFEYLFDYKTQMVAIAEIKLTNIETRHAEFIELEDGKSLSVLLAGDAHALRKLQKLEENSITLTPTKLNELKDSHNLDIELNVDTGKMKVLSKKDAKTLINILNDDYLSSSLTAEKYAVQSKKKVSA